MRQRHSRLSSVLAFAAALMLATPAWAQTTPEGAEVAKKMVEDALGFHLEMAKRTGEGLHLGGPVTATPKGAYYEIKLPDVQMKSQDAHVKVGTILINATPEADGDYRVSLAVPSRMTMVDGKNVERMVMTLGTQKFSGVWRPSLGMFTQAEGDYDNVTATLTPEKTDAAPNADPVSITMGRVSSKISMTNQGNLWTGPQTTTASDVNLRFGPDKSSVITIGQLDGTVIYENVDLTVTKKLRDELRTQLAAGEGEISPAMAQKMLQSATGGLQALPEGMSSTFRLSNFTLDVPAQKKADGTAGTPLKLAIAGLSSDSRAKGLKTDTGNVEVKTRAEGISVTGASGPMAGLIPSEASFKMTGASVPFKSILDTFTTAISGALEAEAAGGDGNAVAQQQMSQALAALPAMLAKAKTSIAINDTFLNAQDLSTVLTGAMTATDGAPYIFAGTTTLVLNGMDELIAKLQETARNSNNPQAAGYAQMLLFMQMSGQPGKAADGKSTRTYALELTQDGRVLLNGADMKALIPAAAIPALQARPAPKTP